jgi:hypothetical protein
MAIVLFIAGLLKIDPEHEDEHEHDPEDESVNTNQSGF